ncbi:MAG: methyltransferase domain-containing protein, partial [Comamonadaceae bacterium]
MNPPGAGHAAGSPAPSAWVRRWTHLAGPGARVLDIACGSGRHMQWFSARGHAVQGVDRDPAAVAGSSAFGPVLKADLEMGPWPFPPASYGVVVVTNYLWRALLPDIVASVAPGGLLLYETFAAGHGSLGRPRRPEFLLEPGELLRACAGLRVVAYEDGFEAVPTRFVQRIAAVRQPAEGDPPARPELRGDAP